MAISGSDHTSVRSLGGESIDTVVDSDGVVLVAFYTGECDACKAMEPPLAAIASDTNATVLTVDIETHLETAIEFGAQTSPSVVLFVDGRPVKRRRGRQTGTALRDLVESYLE